MGFFSVHGGSKLLMIPLLIILFFATYGFFAIVAYIIKTLAKENDELEHKTFVNALAVSFVFILILHLVQMLVREIYFEKTGQDINVLVKPGLIIYAFDKPRTHLESFGVDLGAFGIILFLNRLRYKELNFWKDLQGLASAVANAFRY
ncbi:hypothetical protein [Enterococcus sp. AZ109]|uniref:hypothetical protein n=1 Tax=Enterococcus sp. AZ109 TaxID=2774634 RepID=UPI003F20959B